MFLSNFNISNNDRTISENRGFACRSKQGWKALILLNKITLLHLLRNIVMLHSKLISLLNALYFINWLYLQ